MSSWRSLAKGEIDLRVGNGARIYALEVGTFDLVLPSGLVIELENCYFVPEISRNIISIPTLDKDGFNFVICNNEMFIFRDKLFYGKGCLFNGLYILNTESSNSVYNINTKRFKSNDLNQTYFWHCRLGQVNEKRISKLHKSGLLDSFDYESYESCESCLMDKMAKNPFKKKGERATELLGLIHSDVCGPMSSPARESPLRLCPGHGEIRACRPRQGLL